MLYGIIAIALLISVAPAWAQESIELWVPQKMIAGQEYQGMIIAKTPEPNGVLAFLSISGDSAGVPETVLLEPDRNHATFPITPIRAGEVEILAAMQGRLYDASSRIFVPQGSPSALHVELAANKTRTDSVLGYVILEDQNGTPVPATNDTWVNLAGVDAVSVPEQLLIHKDTAMSRFEAGIRGSGGVIASSENLTSHRADIEKIQDESTVRIAVAPDIAMPESSVFYYVWIEKDGKPYRPPHVLDAHIHTDNWDVLRLEENPSVKRPGGMRIQLVDGVAKGTLYTGNTGHATLSASVDHLGSARDDLFVGQVTLDSGMDVEADMADQDLIRRSVFESLEPNTLISWIYPPVTYGKAWIVAASYHADQRHHIESGTTGESGDADVFVSETTILTPAVADELSVKLSSSPGFDHDGIYKMGSQSNAVEIPLVTDNLGRYTVTVSGHDMQPGMSSADVVLGYTHDLDLDVIALPVLPDLLEQDLAMVSVYDGTDALVDTRHTLGIDTVFDVYGNGVRLSDSAVLPVHSGTAVVRGILEDAARISVVLDGVGSAEHGISVTNAASMLEILAPSSVHVGEEFVFFIHELNDLGIPIRKAGGLNLFSPDITLAGASEMVAGVVGDGAISAVSNQAGAAEHEFEAFENPLAVSLFLDKSSYRMVEPIEVRISSSTDADYAILSDFDSEQTGDDTFLVTPDHPSDSSTITVIAERDGYETATASETISVRETYLISANAVDGSGALLDVPFDLKLGTVTSRETLPYSAEVGATDVGITMDDAVSVGEAGYVLAGIHMDGRQIEGNSIQMKINGDISVDAVYERVVLINVIDGTGSGVYGYGDMVHISAPDKEILSFLIRDTFDHWDGLPSGVHPAETFVAIDDMEIVAVYREDYTYLMAIIFAPLAAAGTYTIYRHTTGFKWFVQNVLEKANSYIPAPKKRKKP